MRYSLTLSPSALPSRVAEDLAGARSGRAESRERLLGLIREKVTLMAQGTRCEPAQGFLEPPRAGGESLTLVVDFACATPVRDLRVRDDLFDVLGPDHHTLAQVEGPSGIQQLVFTTEARDAHVTVGEPPDRARGVASFFALGIHHILSGYDPLLFLLALLLRGGGLLSLLKIVTAFTLAHSVTLALAVLDIVTLPDRLVEAVIALSIAFVAAENLSPRLAVARRWAVSFVFGLGHGFGFSTALRELGLPRERLALSLLGFNLGVEAGQALVVAVLLPLLLLLRRTAWEGRLVSSGSLAILLLGVVLFVERLLLA